MSGWAHGRSQYWHASPLSIWGMLTRGAPQSRGPDRQNKTQWSLNHSRVNDSPAFASCKAKHCSTTLCSTNTPKSKCSSMIFDVR